MATLSDRDRVRFHDSYVESGDSCWLWKTGDGRAQFGYRDSSHRRGWVSTNAARVMWLLRYGQPGLLFVCHHCDNPRCVNPKHLFLGNHSDNLLDMYRKGKGRRGRSTSASPDLDRREAEVNISKLLTEDEVIGLIRSQLAEKSQRTWACEIGDTEMAVSLVLNGRMAPTKKMLGALNIRQITMYEKDIA